MLEIAGSDTGGVVLSLVLLLLRVVVIFGTLHLFRLPRLVVCTVAGFDLWFKRRLVVCFDAVQPDVRLAFVLHFVWRSTVCCATDRI